MPKAKFEKITRSDSILYGLRKLLLCGFSISRQSELIQLVQKAGVTDLPLVWVLSDQADTRLADLLHEPDNSGLGVDSTLPRAIIVSGITENELHRLMDTYRQSGMGKALWASLTPTSETWSMKALLMELNAERESMPQKKQP